MSARLAERLAAALLITMLLPGVAFYALLAIKLYAAVRS